MSKKVVLFLSTVNDHAKETLYSCPDGSQVEGTQTNEAPVKYFLRAYPDISEILCIVTTEASGIAWEWFHDAVKDIAPSVRVTNIPFTEGTDFVGGPLRAILERTEKGDEILLETTGGFRDAVMYLLLLSRMLYYTEIKTICALYSNQREKKIQDVSHLIRMFNLVGGMQELTSFGSTRTLREYYGDPAEDAGIEALLAAVEGLQDAIMLCRTEQIDARVAEFEAAMSAAEHCDDLLMRQLLPAFRKKYGKKMTILGVIKWCVESDMLQQALTIYKERIPSYLLNERKDLFEIRRGAVRKEGRDYQNADELFFLRQIQNMGSMKKPRFQNADEGDPIDLYYLALRHFANLLPASHIQANCSVSKLQTVIYDYFYIRLLRNATNHALDSMNPSSQQLEKFST